MNWQATLDALLVGLGKVFARLASFAQAFYMGIQRERLARAMAKTEIALKKKEVENEVSSLSDAAVVERLRNRWQRPE